MDTKIVVVVLVGILVILAGIQIIQVNGMKTSIAGQAAGYAQPTSPPQYPAPASSGGMVGGC